jgi:hypothetical protein
MGGACSEHGGGNEKYVQIFWLESLKGRDHWEDLGLKMETARFSESLVFTYKSTWHYNPEEQHDISTAVRI